MAGPEFFQTQMGQQFFQSTMPRLVRALEAFVHGNVETTLARYDMPGTGLTALQSPPGPGWRAKTFYPTAGGSGVLVLWERSSAK